MCSFADVVFKAPAVRMIKCSAAAQSPSVYFYTRSLSAFGAEWNLVPYAIL